MFSYKYIPEENEKNLKTYGYSGKDNSVLYNYILGPIAEICLRYNQFYWNPFSFSDRIFSENLDTLLYGLRKKDETFYFIRI